MREGVKGENEERDVTIAALSNLELLMKRISEFTLECRRMTKFEKNSCCKICQENLRRERERT